MPEPHDARAVFPLIFSCQAWTIFIHLLQTCLMTNKEIASAFRELGDLMELHGENPFKVRSYHNAYVTLRKLGKPLGEMTADERKAIPGVGKAIADKIGQLLDHGTIETLERFRSMTPEGVREILSIKGLGPKKVATLWKDLGVESPGELWYACNENRLLELSGFGEKTQEDIREKLEFFFEHQHDHLYAVVEDDAMDILDSLQKFLDRKVVITGSLRRLDPVIGELEFLAEGKAADPGTHEKLKWDEKEADSWSGVWDDKWQVRLYWQGTMSWGEAVIRTTGDSAFLEQWKEKGVALDGKDEMEAFVRAGLPYIEPERRHYATEWVEKELLEVKDVKGVVHTHSTWSDGLNSIEEMVEASRKRGFEYLVITDHSKAAFYANGLSAERVLAQFEEIEKLNGQYDDFKIFKGIESDILNNGALDYDDDILARFDVVIASIHSNLKMDKDKAMMRLIKAVENPYTTILGHPTGRLLLSRPGYPVDHEKLIDACAANGVAIEINANPYRLDLDWTWVRTALDSGVRICINPDAHSTAGIDDIRFGVNVARKAGMTAKECLNARDVKGFEDFLRQRK